MKNDKNSYEAKIEELYTAFKEMITREYENSLWSFFYRLGNERRIPQGVARDVARKLFEDTDVRELIRRSGMIRFTSGSLDYIGIGIDEWNNVVDVKGKKIGDNYES